MQFLCQSFHYHNNKKECLLSVVSQMMQLIYNFQNYASTHTLFHSK
ncbi:PAN domain-containing protein [Bacillus salipaludis]